MATPNEYLYTVPQHTPVDANTLAIRLGIVAVVFGLLFLIPYLWTRLQEYFVDTMFEGMPISMTDNDYLEKRWKNKNLLTQEVLEEHDV